MFFLIVYGRLNDRARDAFAHSSEILKRMAFALLFSRSMILPTSTSLV